VMKEFNIQGKQTSFYKYCPGTFGYILVYIYICTYDRPRERQQVAIQTDREIDK